MGVSPDLGEASTRTFQDEVPLRLSSVCCCASNNIHMHRLVNMQANSKRTTKHISLNQDVYLQARVAALMAQQGVGEWIEEAIISRLGQESVCTQEISEVR